MKTISFSRLNELRIEAARCGIGSKAWIDFASVMFDTFPALYETAKTMNRESERLRFSANAANNFRASLLDLMATIDLHTDCMDNRIDRQALEPYLERADELVENNWAPGDPFDIANFPVVFDLIAHLHRQRRFSAKTFGPGPRSAAIIDHLCKELREIEAAPAYVYEWVDVVLLALDGAWRAGFEPNEIAFAIATKQLRNEDRDWPDWHTANPDKAICHVRELEQSDNPIQSGADRTTSGAIGQP